MIIDTIQEWFKEVLIDGIISNLSGTFDTVNTKVAEIAGEVGMTPSGWNGGIFNMIRSLSETVIVPIAGIILTFVMCYELIQLIVEKNNLHDFDTWLFWKWIFKTFCAVLIVTNTWNIVMAVLTWRRAWSIRAQASSSPMLGSTFPALWVIWKQRWRTGASVLCWACGFRASLWASVRISSPLPFSL